MYDYVYKGGQLISEGNFGVFKSSYVLLYLGRKKEFYKIFFYLETMIFFINVHIDILKLYSMNKEAHYYLMIHINYCRKYYRLTLAVHSVEFAEGMKREIFLPYFLI